jgi:sugar lactone lactonase YvrE
MMPGMPAPELPAELEWVNTREAPRLAAMRGRVVVLAFWTGSDVHSRHVAADLRHLESKYHDGLSVLALHVPRFDGERATASVLKAVNRNYLRCAVANDTGFRCWQLFDVRAWPTLVVIDTDGKVHGSYVGEGRRGEIDEQIGRLLEEAAERDARVYETLAPASRAEPKLPLRFPARVLATDTHLYVADTGHNRILECNHDGRILRQFGSGNPGFWDGKGQDAGFNAPTGTALIKDALYIADCGNHAIRRVRLINGDVETIAGTGQAGHEIVVDAEDPRAVALASPQDVAAAGERLFVAQAGLNQVWSLDLGRHRIGRLAGSGRHEHADGGAEDAGLAQPRGLACQGQMLYVADADNSAIRSVRLLDSQVRTLIGVGTWEFGDKDGLPDNARLQHPAGVAVDPGGAILWVADTLNSKIKALSLRGGGVRTLAVPYRFHEPTGVSAAAKSLWIANTNAHEIVRIDTASGQIRRLPIGE